MKKFKLLTLMIIFLISILACYNGKITGFDVVNTEQCKNTGECEFKASINVDGKPLKSNHRDSADTLSINWGDGNSYSGTIDRAIDDGICLFGDSAFILKHNYDSIINGKVSVSFDLKKLKNKLDSRLYYSIELCDIISCEVPDSLSITTFNTGLSKGHVDYYDERKEPVLDAINKLETDIICLQEVWADDDAEDISRALKHKYPYSYYKITKNIIMFKTGKNGLLTLSKYPLKNNEYINLDSFFIQRSALYTVVETEYLGDVSVVNTHLSTEIAFPPYMGKHGNWIGEQVAQSQAILNWKDTDIILGDFNSGPAVGDKITAFTPEAYEEFSEAGYYSPLADMEEPPCTWCEANPIGGGGYGDLIIDHIFFKNNSYDFITEQVLYSDLIVEEGKEIKISDHAGVRVIVK